jgi:hypothetical protein
MCYDVAHGRTTDEVEDGSARRMEAPVQDGGLGALSWRASTVARTRAEALMACHLPGRPRALSDSLPHSPPRCTQFRGCLSATLWWATLRWMCPRNELHVLQQRPLNSFGKVDRFPGSPARTADTRPSTRIRPRDIHAPTLWAGSPPAEATSVSIYDRAALAGINPSP